MEYGLPVTGLDRLSTLAVINQFLLQQVEHGKDTVLIIDEAQDLTDELLEQVRLLSNLETDDRKLLQIVLMGQPELRDRLNNPKLRQLRQRITVRFHLPPLVALRDERNTSGIACTFPARTASRISPSRRCGACIVTAVAFRGWSTRVCDKALLAGFVKQTGRINFSMVGLAIRELEGNI